MFCDKSGKNQNFGSRDGNGREKTIFREDITANALLSVRFLMTIKSKPHEKRFYAFVNASPQAPAGNGSTTYLTIRPCLISFKLGLTGVAEFAHAISSMARSNQSGESWVHWSDASKVKIDGEARGGARDTKSLRVDSGVDNRSGVGIVNIVFSQTVSAQDALAYEVSSGRQFFSKHSKIKKDTAGNYRHFVAVTLGKYASLAFSEALLVYVSKARQMDMDMDIQESFSLITSPVKNQLYCANPEPTQVLGLATARGRQSP